MCLFVLHAGERLFLVCIVCFSFYPCVRDCFSLGCQATTVSVQKKRGSHGVSCHGPLPLIWDTASTCSDPHKDLKVCYMYASVHRSLYMAFTCVPRVSGHVIALTICLALPYSLSLSLALLSSCCFHRTHGCSLSGCTAWAHPRSTILAHQHHENRRVGTAMRPHAWGSCAGNPGRRVANKPGSRKHGSCCTGCV